MNQESITGIRHQKGVNALEARQLTQEVSHSSVGWKSHGTILLDCKGVLLVDYLPHKITMTGPHYSELLKNLRQAFTENWRGMLTQCPLLLHDNAPVHMSQVARAV